MKIKNILTVTAIIVLVPAAMLGQDQNAGHSFTLASDYDYGHVTISERHGLWRQWTNRLTWRQALISPYIEVNDYDRFQLQDRAVDGGSYFFLPGHDYISAAIGLGLKHQYIYRWQLRLGYAHMLKKYLYWESGYQYRDYDTGRVNMYTQGLTKYFGDSFLSAKINLAHTSSRSNAWSGIIQANLALVKDTVFWSGLSYGERIYDTYDLTADKQKGFLASAGISRTFRKKLTLKIGASYGQEDPDFRLRSLLAGVEIKF